MKKILILLSICSALSLTAQNQIKSGLIIKGGNIGSVRSKIKPQEEITDFSVSYKSSFSLGYRFRIQAASSLFFLDLDANVGLKKWEYICTYDYTGSDDPYQGMISGYRSPSQYYFTSLGGSVNYTLYKNLSIGTGIEPAYFFYMNGTKSEKNFDLPLVGKLAYNFGFMEVGIQYKYGLSSSIKTYQINSAQFSDWQITVFIPF